MNNIWQNEYVLRAGDFDKFDRIKPSAVLDLFQDAACQHAVELNLGFDDMLKLGYLWVLVRVKFSVLKKPNKYQKVTVKTWPLPPHRLSYKREYCMQDENGEILIKGTSDWVVIDSNERRLLSVADIYPLEKFCADVMFCEKISKVRDFETDSAPYSVLAGYSEIDVNGHVNNTKYADFVMNAISPDSSDELLEFQIDYRKEVLEGASIEIYHIRDDDTITAKGVNQNGDIMFACKMELNR